MTTYAVNITTCKLHWCQAELGDDFECTSSSLAFNNTNNIKTFKANFKDKSVTQQKIWNYCIEFKTVIKSSLDRQKEM